MKNTFQDMIKPILVLFIIAVCSAALLGYVHSLTEPVIEENTRIQEEENRKAVLEGATEFTEIECDFGELEITGAYKEKSGLGYVFTAANKGYGGDVVVTVGLDASGKIVGLKADVSTETSGVGTKAGREDYLNQFMGKEGSCDDVDKISGATYSSTALKKGINDILKAFETIVKEAE